MAQELTSSESSAVGSDMLPPMTLQRSRVGIWLLRRIACCVGTMFLTFIAVILIVEWYKPQMMWPGRDSWIWWWITPDRRFRWGRVSAVGISLGLLIPDRRLPNWLTRPLLGLVLGMFVGVFAAKVLDSIMAEIAVSRAYAPFAGVELPVHLDRPLLYEKFYPSAYRLVFSQVLVQGGVLGLIVGMAWSLRSRLRVIAWTLIVLVTMALTWSWQRSLSEHFDSYVVQQQKWIRQWHNLRRVGPEINPATGKK